MGANLTLRRACWAGCAGEEGGVVAALQRCSHPRRPAMHALPCNACNDCNAATTSSCRAGEGRSRFLARKNHDLLASGWYTRCYHSLVETPPGSVPSMSEVTRILPAVA